MAKGTVQLDLEKMKPLLINMGMTWTAVARAAGITPIVFTRAKKGGKVMPATVKKVADVLGCKPLEIAVLSNH